MREGLAHDVGYPSSRCPKSKHRHDFRRAFWVAERSRRGDRICRSWHFKNHINLSVIVMRVTETGDKVVYRLGRDKGRSRTPTSYGGATRGRRGDQSLRGIQPGAKPLIFMCFHAVLFGNQHEIWPKQHTGKVRLLMRSSISGEDNPITLTQDASRSD
jgi:hypothetical protein